MERQDIAGVEPRTISIVAASKMLGVGRTKVYQLLQTGEVRSFLLGRRRLVIAEDIDRLVERSLGQEAH